MSKAKVGITLHAMMSSTRLTKKATRKICGREMIAHHIDRLKQVKNCSDIVLCTSLSEEDRVLGEIAEREGIHWYRGPSDDLVIRLLGAAEKYGFDYCIASAGDNPLTDAEHTEVLADLMVNEDLDYADGVYVLPIGMFTKAVKTEALKKICEMKAGVDTGGYMVFFEGTDGLFKIGKHKRLPWVSEEDLAFRMTVDYQEDFELVKRMIEHFYDSSTVFPMSKALEWLRKNPSIITNNQIDSLPNSAFPFELRDDYKKYVVPRKYHDMAQKAVNIRNKYVESKRKAS